MTEAGDEDMGERLTATHRDRQEPGGEYRIKTGSGVQMGGVSLSSEELRQLHSSRAVYVRSAESWNCQNKVISSRTAR